MNKPLTLSIIITTVVFLSGCQLFTSPTPTPQACTLEAKMCPDGSAVGRSGPNCEFAPCPSLSPLPTSSPTASESSGANITVTSPSANQTASFPLTVTGQARVFENVLQVRLKDANGQKVQEVTTQANSPDVGQFGPFKATLTIKPTTPTATLEVFNHSAKDGSEENVVSVPLRL